MTDVVRNIRRAQELLAEAAVRSGRAAESITLVAVSKTVPAERIAEARAAGLTEFGESYVQEALAKQSHPLLQDDALRWHFIGHLQRNKARDVPGRFALIHGVDSVALAREIGKRSQRAGIRTDILLEVKLDTGSDTKFGVGPAAALDAAAELDTIEGVRLLGLMGMSPFDPEPESARPYFRRLRKLFDSLPEPQRHVLSMGMSRDFEIAVEEGATLVRVGTAIFGGR
jgi:pyridoxal phosphate enzyme (YggS family)